ncbi:MAG TPA: YqgE/AlgH family protein [Rubricoccaceae bacterium]|nr:YqgE/AlgH family protein [Rubricoccaceae bacterium]
MTPLAPGTLLVAEPPMPDPNFRRTVVLLCDHTTEGSFGLVLNRPCEFRLAEVATVPLPFDAALGFGGPVQVDTLHYVHPFGDLVEGALPVSDGVWWGGEFDALLAGIEQGWVDAAEVRFFVGYSGWGPGQLDGEVDEGSWIVLPATADLVFAAGDDALWRQVLRALGGDYALLSTFPDDPRMN